ncbi:hypothetical protein C1H46_017853 [Malus baccata]|uniref:non-specific serine/threonine protein kinase n=1 Tax=Malus baccata TaxID=106549 RepID=A0A540MCU5_MALBA|nr:hypothetical protein C1H46_017853 [Malus baccata]
MAKLFSKKSAAFAQNTAAFCPPNKPNDRSSKLGIVSSSSSASALRFLSAPFCNKLERERVEKTQKKKKKQKGAWKSTREEKGADLGLWGSFSDNRVLLVGVWLWVFVQCFVAEGDFLVMHPFSSIFSSNKKRVSSINWNLPISWPLCYGFRIAVKRLKVWSNNADMEFAVEVEILARVRHKNLLSLRGYCAEGQERLIVYDYMPNLSLLSHLHGQHSAECLLDWTRRMNIVIGSAEGVAYLHHHATPHIIHRDIKASNVLVDSDFQAQVADFGFAKLIPDGATHVTTRVKDPKLNGKYLEDELKRVVFVALLCAHSQPERRLTMLEAVELLKGESKEKLAQLENDELFKAPQVAEYNEGNDGTTAAEEHSSDVISEEKDEKKDLKEEAASGSAHNG